MRRFLLEGGALSWITRIDYGDGFAVEWVQYASESSGRLDIDMVFLLAIDLSERYWFLDAHHFVTDEEARAVLEAHNARRALAGREARHE